MNRHMECALHCQAVLLDGWPECVVECERTKRRASVESGQNAAPEQPTPRTDVGPFDGGVWKGNADGLVCLLTRIKELEELADHQMNDAADARLRVAELERELAAARRDAERWKFGLLYGWPEYCPHWEGAPKGDGWYHDLTGLNRFDTADAAIDAAMHNDDKRRL